MSKKIVTFAAENEQSMAANETKLARLKELMRLAKVNGFAKNQSEFCTFIGKGSSQTLSNLFKGRGGSADNYIEAATTALENKGIHIIKPKSTESRVSDLESRIERIERILKVHNLQDETL